MPPRGQSPLRLCDFLKQRHGEILEHWEHALRRSAEAERLTSARLRDHVPALLARIADIVRTAHEPQGASLEDLPDLHALDRLESGFELVAAASELALLRDIALDLWQPHVATLKPSAVVAEVRKLNQAVDEVVARSVDRYARARERTLVALDRVSTLALGTGDLERFLPQLLHVLLETTRAADSAYVLLRDEHDPERFRVQAAAGTNSERSIGFSVRSGEGFAGEVVRRREPMLLNDASRDPLVLNPALRGEPVHALYGVPLQSGDEVIGVAKLASRSAYDFSNDDKQLFRAMAQRATSIIIQAQLVARERRALEAQRRRAAELRRVMEMSPDMLTILGADGRMKRVNPAFGVVLGYSEDELLAMPYQTVIHPEDREKVAAEVRTVFGGSPAHRFTFRVVRKDGSFRWVSFNASAEPNGEVLVAVGRDVTEERERSEFEQQLIGIVSHDLRSPLSTILMSATTLSRRAQDLDERTLKSVGRIHAAAERASALIRDLLDFTKARTSGGILIATQLVDLHAEARRVAAEVQAMYDGREVKVEQHGDGQGFWDPARIAQVIENLVSNALKYGSPDAPVIVRTLAEERSVRLEVHNEGNPIDPALLPHLFEPLRQGRRTGGVGGVAGVGLGLYIVHHIVRAHGGTIDVRSSASEGTTFFVQLPRDPPASAQASQ